MTDLTQLAIGTAVGLAALTVVLWSHRTRTTTAYKAAVVACALASSIGVAYAIADRDPGWLVGSALMAAATVLAALRARRLDRTGARL